MTRRRALLIGTENYRDDRFTRLPSTRADLAKLREVLADRTVGGFDVDVRADLPADEMRRAIDDFCRESDAHQLTLIYITGHGVRGDDGEFVFVAADTDHGRLGETGVRAGFVNDVLEGCYADQKVAVFDTCDSGAFTLGFRSAPTKGAPAPAPVRAPLTPRGVYVLASSDVSEASYSGGGTTAEPEPSVFTGEVVDVLRTGAAGTSASGMVSVDDLFKAVAARLRVVDPPQTPVMSAIRVNADIPIAARPHGGAARAVGLPTVDTVDVAEFEGVAPDWPQLLAYYIDVVRAEIQELPLLPVQGGSHVMLSGSERALRGDVDADGCIPVPPGAEELVAQAVAKNGPELWTGWPAVLLYRNDTTERRRWRGPHFAPLLMRQLEVISADGSTRLRPDGPVVPHPGLTNLLLDAETARQLMISYRPAWHQGESGRMAQEAGLLLRDEFDLPCVEELRPEQLAGEVNTATAGEGARNAAVLFHVEPDSKTGNLLKDLEWILGRPTTLDRTALAALYPSRGDGRTEEPPRAVLPLPANPAQQEVLESAMTRRLTVATGPPGTGKSQLVVNAVATAVAAGQSVLVASTNNTAVDEVHRRCEQLVPGLVLRTGNPDAQIVESDGLQALLTRSEPTRTPESREQAFRLAARSVDATERRLAEIAQAESELLAIGKARAAAERALGRTVERLTAELGDGWGARARALQRAWFFGSRRRDQFLRPAGLHAGELRQTCEALAALSELDESWHGRREAADFPPDDDLDRDLLSAHDALAQASVTLLDGLVADRASTGDRQLKELRQVKADSGGAWNERRAAMTYVKGWALTSYSARRFKTEPAMFDLVIIDEASQCSIPAIVPLLYRARRALVIGDMMQLPHISTLDARADAALRANGKISREWLTDHRLSPVKHSAFAAAEQVVGKPMLLDEHYRCHPDIIGVSNRLFYRGRLTVLTNSTAPGRVTVSGPAVVWRHVAGEAVRGRSGTSWRNRAEVDEVERCVDELLATLPPEATIGVVTPYAPQSAELGPRLRRHGERVRVGTAHKFQGGERDVMVLSLVAASNQPPRSFDWADHQPELWNVAITRARSQLVVVGDRSVWEERGRIGGELLATARAPRAAAGSVDDELADRLHAALCDSPETELELGVAVNGHRADAVFRGEGREQAIVLDPGCSNDASGAHLRLMLRRRALLGDSAVRIPAWMLFDDEVKVRQRMAFTHS